MTSEMPAMTTDETIERNNWRVSYRCRMGANNRADVALTTQLRLSGTQPPNSDSHHCVDTPARFWFPEEGHQGIVSFKEMERALSEGREVFSPGKSFHLHRRHVE